MGLGTWQLQRKTEKEALLNSLAQNQYKLPQDVDSLQTLEPFTPLYAQGHFVPGKTIFLQAKTYKGKSGVYVLDLFKTEHGNTLLIQRGWASKEIFSLPLNKIKVEGIGRYPSKPNFFQPQNQPPTYFWIDLKGLSQSLNIPLLPYYLVAKDSFDPQILPTEPFPIPSNNHFQYAITWYFLAFLIGSVLLWKNIFHRKKD
jgi:surfeit locus 1 family protein